MNILQNFWRYWKWLCVALMTTFVLLYAAATIINYFKSPSEDKKMIGECIDRGGTWDAVENICKTAA